MGKRRGVSLLVLALALIIASLAHSDSPLTSTDFYQAYLDVDMVKKAKDAHAMNQEIADYLVNEKMPLDVKAAVINALGWNINGQTNAEQFSRLALRKPLAELDLDQLNAGVLMCVGYLMALDDYFNTEKALAFLEKAKTKKPKSSTIAIIRMLVWAQTHMDEDNTAQLSAMTARAMNDPSLTEDPMRPEARKIIQDYLP